MNDDAGTDDPGIDDAGADSTVCPFCGVGCRLGREGDRVIGRSGPANPDGRLCEKGLAAFEPRSADDRLMSPLVREDGDLVPVTWETAIDRAVDAFRTILDDHGPDALSFLGAPRCTNEENYLLQKLARTLGTNNVDNRARLCHDETARALADRLGWPATTNSLADLGRADAIVVVGANPAARQPVAFNSYVRPAVADGAALIHVDPHRNETTRLADQHLEPRPGTDALVVSLLTRLVADRGGVDDSFVEDRTRDYDRFEAWLDDLDVPAGTLTAGVDRDALEGVASTLADADRVAVMTGTGADDGPTADALVNFLLLSGNLGRPGTGLFVLRGLANEQGAIDAGCVPDRLPGHQPVTDPEAREVVATEWGIDPPATPGLNEHEAVATFGEDVHGALVVGENPAISKQDPDWLGRKLAGLDALVVSELRPSETTRHADVVFPAAAGVEKAGTMTNLDRQVQRLHPLARPPDGVRSDFEILQDVGRRLVGDGFEYESPAEAFAELVRIAPPYAGLSDGALDDGGSYWPTDDAGSEDDRGILYRTSFATEDGLAPFTTVALPSPERTDALQIVIGDRAGRFLDDADASAAARLIIHPEDAAGIDVADGDRVVVTNDAATIEASASVRDSIREGVVYAHASVGDPLVRGGASTVTVRPATAVDDST